MNYKNNDYISDIFKHNIKNLKARFDLIKFLKFIIHIYIKSKYYKI
jgi:hypothetical protein